MRRPTSALYVCYMSLEDPLIHTQVVAYLEGLARLGHRIHLLTFDTKMDREQRGKLSSDLERRGITWHSLPYHKRPSLPATIYDALVGSIVAARLFRKHRLKVLHARAHVPAASALLASRLTGARLIFDMRGLMGEENVDAGRWRPGSLAFRITKQIERAAIRRAVGAVVLTERVRRHLFGPGRRDAVEVIPCCVDLERLDSGRGASSEAREKLELDDRPTMVYVGKFTGWYLEREMVEFFSVARTVTPGLVFLVITQADPDVIAAEFERYGIPTSDYRITQTDPDEIGRYLAAADFGISFIRPCFSKIASSPTKIGEYLGAGLPVLSTSGIGDLDELLGGDRIGVLIDGLSRDAYLQAAHRMGELVNDARTPERCRTAARAHLSLRDVGVPRYDRLYRRVAGD